MGKAKTEEQKRRNAERSKLWREKNPDYMKGYMQKYNAEHVEKRKETGRAYHAENREAQNEYRRQWAINNPERNAKTCHDWYVRNKDRVRDANLRKKYGIGVKEFEALLEAQGGGCAICGTTVNPQRGKSMHLDHDHKTGAVRGILCHPHNVLLGLVNDDTSLLLKAIGYLEKHSCLPPCLRDDTG